MVALFCSKIEKKILLVNIVFIEMVSFILPTIKNVEFMFQMYVHGRHIWYKKGPYMQRALVTLNTR